MGEPLDDVSTPPPEARSRDSDTEEVDADSGRSASMAKSITHMTRSVSKSLRTATRSVQQTSARVASAARSMSKSVAPTGRGPLAQGPMLDHEGFSGVYCFRIYPGLRGLM